MSKPPPKGLPKPKSDEDDDDELETEEDQARLKRLSAPGMKKQRQNRPGGTEKQAIPSSRPVPIRPTQNVVPGPNVEPPNDKIKKSNSDTSFDGSDSSHTPPKVAIARPLQQVSKKTVQGKSVNESPEVQVDVPEDLKVNPDAFQTKERAWKQKVTIKEPPKLLARLPDKAVNAPKDDKEKPPPRLEFMDPAFPTFGGRRSAVTKPYEVKSEIPITVPAKEKPKAPEKVTSPPKPKPKPPEIPKPLSKVEEPVEQSVVVEPTLPAHSENRKSALDKMKAAVKQPKRVIELTKAKAVEMFGYQSKLAQMDTALFTAEYSGSGTEDDESRTVSSGNTSGPDESWILEWSGDDMSESSDEEREELQRKYTLNAAATNAALSPLFLVMFFIGRLPFSGGLSSRFETVYFSFPKNTWKFRIFCVTSGFLFLLWILTMVSAFQILSDDAAESEKYKKLEDLYLEKYWLQISIFLVMLTYINFVNIITLLYGNSVTTWLNSVIRTVNMHDMNLTKWIWIYGVGQLFLLLNYIVYMIFMFRTGATPGVVGGTNALTVVIFHNIYTKVRLNFVAFPHLSTFVFVIELYVLICARICIMLPMLCSMLVRNMALNRNLRIGLIVGTVKTLGNKTTEHFRNALTYRNVFAFHNEANRMLRGFCNLAFPYHICAYYMVKCCVLCLCLFKIAKTTGVSFFPTSEKKTFNETAVVDNMGHLIETYEDAAGATIFDTLILLGVSLLGFIAVTEIFTDCGKSFLDGFTYIRDHSLLRSKGSQERKFVLSLNQCFTAINPYVVSPASLFTINRRFIIRVFEWCGLVFMIMIQTQSSPLLKTPIHGICEDISGNKAICIVAYGAGPRATAPRFNEANDAVEKQLEKIKEAEQLAALNTNITSSSTTRSRTSTAAPSITTPVTPVSSSTTTEPSTTSNEPASTSISTTSVTTTTTTTTTTTAKPRPNKPLFAKLEDFSLKKAARRCAGSDIFRLYGFISTFEQIDLPSDRFECIVRPYGNTKPIFDAFGNEVTEWDDCGFPKLFPSAILIGAVDHVGLEIGENCWTSVPTHTMGEVVLPSSRPETTCGYPTDYASLLCDASKQHLSLAETIELIKASPPLKHVKPKRICHLESFKLGINPTKAEIQNLPPDGGVINDLIYIKKNVTSNAKGVFVRFTAYTQHGTPWPMRKSYFYEVLPYSVRSILDATKPAPYYDCTGKLLEEYDDSGYLGFTTYDPGTGEMTPATMFKRTLKIDGKEETIDCWSIPISLGVNANYDLDTSMSSKLICGILETDPYFNERLEKVVKEFRMYTTDSLSHIGEN